MCSWNRMQRGRGNQLALEKLLQWANIIYISVCGARRRCNGCHLSVIRTGQQHQRSRIGELHYCAESGMEIAIAQAEAAEAMGIAESERRARAELKSQVAAAEFRAAEANAVASEARLELAKLKKPGTIAPENQEKVVAALKGFAGQKFGLSLRHHCGTDDEITTLRSCDFQRHVACFRQTPERQHAPNCRQKEQFVPDRGRGKAQA